MKLHGENYESTAYQWGVTMAYANPMTLEQILYNQKGISNVTQRDLERNQAGNYWYAAGAAHDASTNPRFLLPNQCLMRRGVGMTPARM